MPPQKYNVLLADDCENDRFLIARALREVSPGVVVGMVDDGRPAIEYLSGSPPFADRDQHPFPDVLILDLAMPRVSGFEVLEWLRKETIEGLQIIVLSGSTSITDRQRAQSLGAHVYLVKHDHPAITAQAVARLLRDFTPPSSS